MCNLISQYDVPVIWQTLDSSKQILLPCQHITFGKGPLVTGKAIRVRPSSMQKQMPCVQRAHCMPYGLIEELPREHIKLLIYSLICLLTFETGSHTFQKGFELAAWARMTLNP